MNRRFRLLFVTIVALLGLPTIHGQESTKPEIPKDLAQVLGWLPDDTEALIVASGPFEFPGMLRDNRPFLESARLLSISLVVQIHDGLLAERLQGNNVSIAVEASRRYTSPRGLGMMPFEGCQILKFDVQSQDAVHAAFESCMQKAMKTIQLGATNVALFTEKWEDDEWSLFVAEPLRGVLLCATDQRFLEQLLVRLRLSRASEGRAFPENLPEWEHLDVEAPVWGMRHYRKEFANADPSSPLRPQAEANVPDPDAVGLVFSLDAKLARARYLTRTGDGARIVADGWSHPSENLTPTIKDIKAGVIEITTRIDEEGNGRGEMFLFVLLAYLGHAVYL